MKRVLSAVAVLCFAACAWAISAGNHLPPGSYSMKTDEGDKYTIESTFTPADPNVPSPELWTIELFDENHNSLGTGIFDEHIANEEGDPNDGMYVFGSGAGRMSLDYSPWAEMADVTWSHDDPPNPSVEESGTVTKDE